MWETETVSDLGSFKRHFGRTRLELVIHVQRYQLPKPPLPLSHILFLDFA